MRNARFWIWHNDGWVKLTLKPGQVIQFARYSNDEGWSCTSESYWLDEEDECVCYASYSHGSDCDGPFESYTKSHCQLTELAACDIYNQHGITEWDDFADRWVIQPERQNYGIHAPAWHYGESRQRDYYAESMGY